MYYFQIQPNQFFIIVFNLYLLLIMLRILYPIYLCVNKFILIKIAVLYYGKLYWMLILKVLD